MRGFLISVAILALVGGAGYGGYHYGYQKAEKKAAQNTTNTVQPTVTPTSQLPAVTPVETLRNFLGNFFFDSNFIASGYQQSPSLTQSLIDTVNANQRRQISVTQSFFCSQKIPTTVSFSPQQLAENATTTTVGATEKFQTGPDNAPSYDFVLANGRWQINQVTCPSA